MALLRLARQFPPHEDPFDAALEEAIRLGDAHLLALRQRIAGRIAPRRRPQTQAAHLPPPVTVYIDECGTHSLTAPDPFAAFSLAAILIPSPCINSIETSWQQWKANTLLNPNAVLHEPDIRCCQGPFYFRGDRSRSHEAVRSLSQLIAKTDFTAIVCTLHRLKYLDTFGEVPPDQSLPIHPYLMCLDFLAERIAIALDSHFGGAKAKVVAESRGPREDALLQHEFSRLHLEGTSYLKDSWFRRQMEPGIRFKSKLDNIIGLQIADIVARPCAEKVLQPASTPDRWPEIRPKLCQGMETSHSILGLKIVPWDPAYDRIWES